MEFFECLALRDAEKMVADRLGGRNPASENAGLLAAVGRVCAAELRAPADIPGFDRSTVDGFAVAAADTYGASEGSPAFLEITGEVPMGRDAGFILHPGQAALIHTGGMLPVGADAVVMLEYTECPGGSALLVLSPLAPGENVVRRGEDVKEGSTLIRRGERISPAAAGLLSSSGYLAVPVFRRPRVAILSSGDELVNPDIPPGPGQVRDINSYALAAAVSDAGGQPEIAGIVCDRREEFVARLQAAVQSADAVIISGGSSVGARDHTIAAINGLGGPGVLFHGLTVKPGKPTVFGMAGCVPVFGLPGHPVSALMMFREIVSPAIALLAGATPAVSWPVRALMTRTVASAPGRTEFIRVRLRWDDGRVLAEPLLGKSGLISTYALADGVVRIEEGVTGLPAGSEVDVTLLKR